MKKDKSSQTNWHRILGVMLQELLTPVGITVSINVEVMGDPPEADILLLRTGTPYWTSEQLALLPDGVRDSQANHILLEFKMTESLDKIAVAKTIGYDVFYEQSQRLTSDTIQTFLVSSKTPRKTTLEKFDYSATAQAGVYHSCNIFLEEIPLLILNELADEPHNAFIKTFASHRKEKRKAFEQLWQLPYWDFPRKLQRVLGGLLNYWFPKEGGKMEEGLTIEYFIELGKQAEERFLNSIPVERRLASIPVEKRLASIPIEKRLASIPIEERLASIPVEVMLSQYHPKEVLTVYTPKDVLTMYNPREIIENYPTQTLLAEISAEELMQHLSADVIKSLQKALAESKNQE